MIHADILLRNAANVNLKGIEVQALVDTGAGHLCIPEHVALQLGLTAIDEREVVLSDGRTLVVDYVRPIALSFGTRQAFVGALVVGKEVLLGLIPMSDLDLVIELRTGRVSVNPESPNIPLSGSLPRNLGVAH